MSTATRAQTKNKRVYNKADVLRVSNVLEGDANDFVAF
jgi:hypothetical protein